MTEITLKVKDPLTTASNIADLLCWWEGFKIGLKTGGIEHFIVAEHGIDEIRELNIQIKKQIPNQ